MIVAEVLLYFLFLIVTYSIIIFEALGFQIDAFGPTDSPHWILQWVVMIWIAIAMGISITFLMKRSFEMIIRIYKRLHVKILR